MRVIAVVALVLLAGCAQRDASPEPPTGPIHTGGPELDENGTPIEIPFVPMDPVSGTVSADGTVACTAAGTGVRANYAAGQWDAMIATNATRMTVRATWTPGNPTTETLSFQVAGEGVSASVTGTPGVSVEVDVQNVLPAAREFTVQLVEPACGADPVRVTAFEGQSANIAVSFA